MGSTKIHSLVTPCLLFSASFPILPLFSLHPKQDQSVTKVSRVMAFSAHTHSNYSRSSHTQETHKHMHAVAQTCSVHLSSHPHYSTQHKHTVQQASMHAQTQNTVKKHTCMHPPITCSFTTHDFLLVLYPFPFSFTFLPNCLPCLQIHRRSISVYRSRKAQEELVLMTPFYS